MLSSTSSLLLLSLAALNTIVSARTDLQGCTSSTVIANGGASLLYYVPGTGEICSFLDCGGGRAPPKTTVPGCAGYQGTATVTPSFLPNIAAETNAASSGLPTGSVTSTLAQTSVTDTGLLMATGSMTAMVTPAASGVDGSGAVSASPTVGMGSGEPSSSVSANAAAGTGMGVVRKGGLAGLVVGAVVMVL